MPNLSQFYGITIKMYFMGAEHNPPHIHVQYGAETAELSIMTDKVIAGKLPPKATALVKEWLTIHRQELIEIWETQTFKKIKPLE